MTCKINKTGLQPVSQPVEQPPFGFKNCKKVAKKCKSEQNSWRRQKKCFAKRARFTNRNRPGPAFGATILSGKNLLVKLLAYFVIIKDTSGYTSNTLLILKTWYQFMYGHAEGGARPFSVCKPGPFLQNIIFLPSSASLFTFSLFCNLFTVFKLKRGCSTGCETGCKPVLLDMSFRGLCIHPHPPPPG